MFFVSPLKQQGGWAETGCEAWHDGFRIFLRIDTTPSEKWSLIPLPWIWARLSDPVLVSGMWCSVPAGARSEKGQLSPASWISCHVVEGSGSLWEARIGLARGLPPTPSHVKSCCGWGAPAPLGSLD